MHHGVADWVKRPYLLQFGLCATSAGGGHEREQDSGNVLGELLPAGGLSNRKRPGDGFVGAELVQPVEERGEARDDVVCGRGVSDQRVIEGLAWQPAQRDVTLAERLVQRGRRQEAGNGDWKPTVPQRAQQFRPRPEPAARVFVAGETVGDLTKQHHIVELPAGQLRFAVPAVEAILADNREVPVEQLAFCHLATVTAGRRRVCLSTIGACGL